jgi:hypothetical protein
MYHYLIGGRESLKLNVHIGEFGENFFPMKFYLARLVVDI